MNTNQKLDNWWNNTSMFGYRTGYTITHPWNIYKGIRNEIKWAWQRVFRGYDNRIIWSLDYYLSEMLPVWLRELKQEKAGIPTVCFEEDDWDNDKCEYKKGAIERACNKWDDILDGMIEGFEAHKKQKMIALAGKLAHLNMKNTGKNLIREWIFLRNILIAYGTSQTASKNKNRVI
jgi:hypothetical protein